jgi:hypothetical protein
MKNRVVLWAAVGFVVAAFWALYFYPTSPTPAAPIWTLVRVTCPIAFASLYFHFPVGVSTSLLANTASYALVRLVAETLGRQLSHAR